MDLNSPIMAGLELFVQENPSIAIEDYLGWNPVTEVSPPNVIGWKCTHCRISVDPVRYSTQVSYSYSSIPRHYLTV